MGRIQGSDCAARRRLSPTRTRAPLALARALSLSFSLSLSRSLLFPPPITTATHLGYLRKANCLIMMKKEQEAIDIYNEVRSAGLARPWLSSPDGWVQVMLCAPYWCYVACC